jgi:hypothetical protein
MQLRERDIYLVNALVAHFYDVVPPEYKTYCVLTSRISQRVLKHFGIDAQLLPCQVWLVTENHNFIVGFHGKPGPGKWDGHVVCRAGSLIIDAALQQFEAEFGVQVPSVIASSCFGFPTQVLSRRDLAHDSRFWWHYPPVSPNVDLRVPDEPDALIARYAAPLIELLATLGPAGASAYLPRGSVVGTATDASNH